MREVPFPTPGEILLEEFLKPMGLTQYRLAKEIKPEILPTTGNRHVKIPSGTR